MVSQVLTILILFPFTLQKTIHHTYFMSAGIHVTLYAYICASLVVFFIHLYINLYKNVEKLDERTLYKIL